MISGRVPTIVMTFSCSISDLPEVRVGAVGVEHLVRPEERHTSVSPTFTMECV